MRYLRLTLLSLLLVLITWFVVVFALMVYEQNKIVAGCAANPGFSCDAFPTHIVGGLHMISFGLLLSVVFAQKYFWAWGVAAAYLIINILSTYSRLATGLFGGDMCPEGHPCVRALRRASFFDWCSAIIIMISSVLITSLMLLKKRGLSS